MHLAHGMVSARQKAHYHGCHRQYHNQQARQTPAIAASILATATTRIILCVVKGLLVVGIALNTLPEVAEIPIVHFYPSLSRFAV